MKTSIQQWHGIVLYYIPAVLSFYVLLIWDHWRNIVFNAWMVQYNFVLIVTDIWKVILCDIAYILKNSGLYVLGQFLDGLHSAVQYRNPLCYIQWHKMSHDNSYTFQLFLNWAFQPLAHQDITYVSQESCVIVKIMCTVCIVIGLNLIILLS